MKLTILPLRQLSAQDQIDLLKIWPEEKLDDLLNEVHALYVARFNERLLAALKVEIVGTQGNIQRLSVREVTRRRGVGQYLVEETLAQNSSVKHWRIANDGDVEQEVIAAFMQACGFRAAADGWVKNSDPS